MSEQEPVSHDEFLARALHDLKAPARHVVNFSGMLRDSLGDLPLSDESLRYLETIERSGSNMQQILQSLGEYLRMPVVAGPVSQIDVAELLQYCWNNLSQPGSQDSAEIKVNGTASIRSDARLLDLALTQALHNTRRFRHPELPLAVQCDLLSQGDRCRIRIHDNGIGIDPSFVTRAVEPFAKLPAPDVKCGAGLGLAVCQRAIELLRGTLQLSSDGSSGTTVTFDLPLTLQVGQAN